MEGPPAASAANNSLSTGGFTGGATAAGPVAGFDPVLISLMGTCNA